MPLRFRPPAWTLACGFAFAVMAPDSTQASMITALDLEGLVLRADHIVMVTVVGGRSQWQSKRRIVTDVVLRVDQVVKGARRPGETVPLRCLGGTMGSVAMRVEGEPIFALGMRAVVFASGQGSGEPLRAVGMSQGVFPIEVREGVETVLPGGAGLALVRPVAGGALVTAPGALLEPQPLDQFLERVRAMAIGAPRPR